MLRSMTGFGRGEAGDADRRITVEIKSVNHRYCDISVKMPKKLGFFESAVRGALKDYVQRGKIDVYITYEDLAEHRSCLKYNRELAAEYMAVLRQMQSDFSLEDDIRVSTLSRYPEVLTLEEQEVDEETLWQLLEEAVRKAGEGLAQTRAREGEHLKADLLDKLEGMKVYVDQIEARSPEIITAYRARLVERVKDLLGDSNIDEGRIAMETTLFADKLCVDEEIVRLRSHINTAAKTLKEGGAVGRKLDFIIQEMNREANTILSKANDLIISDTAIGLKTDIEKVREQVQNIE